MIKCKNVCYEAFERKQCMYVRRELLRWREYLVGKRNLLRKRVLRRKRNPLKRCDLQIIHDLLQTFTDQLLKHLPAMISLINPMLHFLVCYELLEIRTAVNFLDLYILGILYCILVWFTLCNESIVCCRTGKFLFE